MRLQWKFSTVCGFLLAGIVLAGILNLSAPKASASEEHPPKTRCLTDSGYVYRNDGTILRYGYSLCVGYELYEDESTQSRDVAMSLFSADTQGTFDSSNELEIQVYIPEKGVVVRETKTAFGDSTVYALTSVAKPVVEYEGAECAGMILSATARFYIDGQQVAVLTLPFREMEDIQP